MALLLLFHYSKGLSVKDQKKIEIDFDETFFSRLLAAEERKNNFFPSLDRFLIGLESSSQTS